MMANRLYILMAAAIVLATGYFTTTHAQVPHEDDIVATINSMESENHYPSLMLRFQIGDPTLTPENYHYLYYGYAYQPTYRPLESNPHIDEFLTLASQIDIDAPDSSALRDIIAVGMESLSHDPFSIKVWNMISYAYGQLGEEREEKAAYKRLEMIIATIKSSGDGLKEDNPQHILMFDHALDVMAADNLQHTKPIVVSRTVEYIPLLTPIQSEGRKVRGKYFDFGRIYWKRPDNTEYKREQSWQFNNLKPQEYRR